MAGGVTALEAVIGEIVSRLRLLPVSRIILFGSSAAGHASAESDLDLAIVLRQPNRFNSYDERLEAKSRLRESIQDINRKVPMDILLYTEDEYAELTRYRGFLSQEVVAKGRTLYERAG